MKLTVLLPSSLVLTLGLGAATARADEPLLVQVPVRSVFVPSGFDGNDDVQAVVDGYLPATCYKVAYNDVAYDAATKTYTVTQWARRASNICLEVLVPFTAEARLGIVAPGKYQVKGAGVDPVGLNVKEAPAATPDDYLYAPIDSAHVERNAETGRYTAVIEGRFTSTCMAWRDLRLTDSGATLELLPIMTLAAREDCRPEEVAFKKTIDLPSGMTPGRHMLHVRSLNGKAANAVFTVDTGTQRTH